MKKIILSIVACSLIASASVFAIPNPALSGSDTKMARTTAYLPTSSHRLAMGGAGLGLAGYYDSYLYNPANISKDGFKIVFPSLTITVNNVYNLMEPPSGDDDVITVLGKFGNDDNASVELATLVLKSIPYNYGEIMTMDTNFGLKTRNFGLDFAVQEKVRSYNGGTDYTTASAISVTTVVTTAGFGFNIPLGEYLSIDLGATGSFNYKVYSIAYDANEALALMSAMSNGEAVADTMMGTIPFASGYALPVTVGANLNLPLGLTVSAVGRNFNGNYDMVAFTNLKSLINNDEVVVAFVGSDSYQGTTAVSVPPSESDSFTAEIPWSLDLGLTFSPTTPLDGLLKPSISLDFIDSYELMQKVIEGNESETQLKSDALDSLNIGAQIRVLSFVDVRAGFSQGYKSVGAGLDLLIVHLDAAYYWKEYGDVVGQNPSDSLSVKFSLLSR